MTAAQKTAKAKFKQAIAYRQKTGVSLKEAFAHIYGKKKVGTLKKKAARKKKTAKKVVRKVVKKKAAPKNKAAKKVVRKLVKKKLAPKKITSKIYGYNTNIIKKLYEAMKDYNMAEDDIILHRGNLKNGIKDPFTKKLNQDIVKKSIKLKKEFGTHIKELKKLI